MLQLNKKKQNDIIDLIDDVLDEGNPFNGTIKTEPEDTFIDDCLLYNTNQKEIKNISKVILQDTNLDQNDVLIEDLPIVTPGKIDYNPYKYKRKPDLKKSASRIKKQKNQKQRQRESLKHTN